MIGSAWNRFLIIQTHIISGDTEEATDLVSDFLISFGKSEYNSVGEIYLWLGENDSAKFYLESAVQSEFSEMSIPRWQSNLALSYNTTGDTEQAQSIIDKLIMTSDTSTIGSPAFFIGLYYSGIGEIDAAFYWLEKAYNNRSIEMPWLKVNPSFNNLKDDDRYWDLYERTGHKAYDEYMASENK